LIAVDLDLGNSNVPKTDFDDFKADIEKRLAGPEGLSKKK
jgi:hypothetical protein